jgi:hypothetical protein
MGTILGGGSIKNKPSGAIVGALFQVATLQRKPA